MTQHIVLLPALPLSHKSDRRLRKVLEKQNADEAAAKKKLDDAAMWKARCLDSQTGFD